MERGHVELGLGTLTAREGIAARRSRSKQFGYVDRLGNWRQIQESGRMIPIPFTGGTSATPHTQARMAPANSPRKAPESTLHAAMPKSAQPEDPRFANLLRYGLDRALLQQWQDGLAQGRISLAHNLVEIGRAHV